MTQLNVIEIFALLTVVCLVTSGIAEYIGRKAAQARAREQRAGNYD
jgi:hypothetical protein